MILEIIGLLCIGYTGYSGYQKIYQFVAAPFSFFSSTTHIVDAPHRAIITTASSGQNPATNINNNQNSAGLFAINYSDGTSSLLGYAPIILCTSIGIGYVAKTKVTQAAQLLHNHTTWTYWVLKNFKKDVSAQDIFEQELQHRCTDEDKITLRTRIRAQIDTELNCLQWFCRITTITKKLYMAWLFDIQEEDIILAQQAVMHLSTLRSLIGQIDKS